MSKHEYSVKEVRADEARVRSMRWHADEGEDMMRVADMLLEHAELLEQIERAKAGVTDEMSRAICAEYERLGAKDKENPA
jgi:hypothetical protein